MQQEFYTKKDLEQKFEISDNTVYNSLKACGLNTGKKKYSESEHDRFAHCRQMYDEGKSTEEIEAYFRQLDQQNSEQQPLSQSQTDQSPTPKPNFSPTTTQKAQSTTKDFDSLVALTVHTFVDQGVQKVLPHIPDMVVHSISQHLNPEQIMEALGEIFQQTEVEDEGNDFLQTIIEIQPLQPQQIQGGREQPQLPQSSLPESFTDSP